MYVNRFIKEKENVVLLFSYKYNINWLRGQESNLHGIEIPPNKRLGVSTISTTPDHFFTYAYLQEYHATYTVPLRE